MLPEHVKIILLSATVPNTMQFAGWVGYVSNTPSDGTHLVKTTKHCPSVFVCILLGDLV